MAGAGDRSEADEHVPLHLADASFEPPRRRLRRRRPVPLTRLIPATLRRLAGSWGGRIVVAFAVGVQVIGFAASTPDGSPGQVAWAGLVMGPLFLLIGWIVSEQEPDGRIVEPPDLRQDLAVVGGLFALVIGVIAGIGAALSALT